MQVTFFGTDDGEDRHRGRVLRFSSTIFAGTRSAQKNPPIMDHATLERFWNKVHTEPMTGCWLWVGAMSGPDGDRPALSVRIDGEKKQVRAYRLAYEHYVGPIPEGLTLDHVRERCSARPRCVNPEHCESVTARENILRSDGPAAVNARKTHCKRGHEFVPGSYYIGKTGNKQCKQCTADTGTKRKAADPEGYAKRAAAAQRRSYAKKKAKDPEGLKVANRARNKLMWAQHKKKKKQGEKR